MLGLVGGGPGLEIGGELLVGDDVHLFDARDGGEVIEHPFHHGFSGHLEEGFCLGQSEGVKAGGVAGGENEDVHGHTGFKGECSRGEKRKLGKSGLDFPAAWGMFG